jgi:hypothetical protein
VPPKRKAAPKQDLNITSTGLSYVDALSANAVPALQDYIAAVSQYVVEASSLSAKTSKTAQIALSAGLGRVLSAELRGKLPRITPHPGELDVAGALRRARADVSEAHPLDGLRLAIEIKPVNLAVGRALWNRFGDIRAFAVNIHLKFPFAVVGGVLVVPTWEWAKLTKAAAAVAVAATVPSEGAVDDVDLENIAEDVDESAEVEAIATEPRLYKRSTEVLLGRLIRRLERTRRRETEADAPHLMEAVTVIVYDPDDARLREDLPAVGSGLRWEEFVQELADAYDVRFED